MKTTDKRQASELLVQSNWVGGVSLSDNVVGLTHILGRRRLVCCRFIAEILLQDFQSPTTIEQVAARRNASVELIDEIVGFLRAALLLRRQEIDENAAVRYALDVKFDDAGTMQFATHDQSTYSPLLQESAPGSEQDPKTDALVDLDTPLQLSSALAAMPLGDSGGVFTHFVEGPLLAAADLWNLAMGFRNKTTLRQVIAAQGLRDEQSDQLLLSCQFLLRRRILCRSPEADIADIRERLKPQIALIERRFTVDKDLTPTSYEDPHFIWYQPGGTYSVEDIRPNVASGNIALLGQCQSHFLAGTLEYLAQRAGWHIETHGWFEIQDDLGTSDWSLIVLPSVLEAAEFYEAFAIGDVAGCRKAMPRIVAEIDRSICMIRERTRSPVLIISVGEASLHGHGLSSSIWHKMKKLLAELNNDIVNCVAGFDNVSLLDETGALSRFSAAVTLDDEYNATPHHAGFNIWSWRDHPLQEAELAMPPKQPRQVHPAVPLAQACLDHMRQLYAKPAVRLIVFEPNGLLWPGALRAGEKPFPKGINVYTGLDDFVYIGIHEALSTLNKRGIRLACVSSSETELLQRNLEYDSEARNLIRRDDVVCAIGGADKPALIRQAIEAAGASENEVLWIDTDGPTHDDFKGVRFSGDIWALRRFLLTQPHLQSTDADDSASRPAQVDSDTQLQAPDHEVIRDTVVATLCRHLKCSSSALQKNDDLSLLGLDSIGCKALVTELENALEFRLPDHSYVGSVLFSRSGLFNAVTRALESRITVTQNTSHSRAAWFDDFSRERWCDQDIGSLIAQHAQNPNVDWIFKFVRSGTPFDYQYLTWRELYASALGYTRIYRNAGLEPGETVTILLPQSAQLIAAIVGAFLAGMTPSVSAFPNEKLTSKAFLAWFSELAGRSLTRAVVCTKELESELGKTLDALDPDIAVITTVPDPAHDEAAHVPNPDAPALVQHSSGTTGIKKGIQLTHREILAQIWDLSRRLECDDDDVIVSWLPYYHDMGLMACLLLPLLRSIPTVVMSPFDWVRQPHMLLREISRERGTLCWLPNFALQHCATRIESEDSSDLNLGSLRALINCSEPITHDAMTAFYDRFSRIGMRFSALASSYAMAESTFAVTQSSPGKPARSILARASTFAADGKIQRASGTNEDVTRFVSSGSILPGVRVRIAADDRILDEDAVGEIEISGDYLFSGYFNDEENTREAFNGEWYRTGDLGFMHEGELYVTGRRKDLIIIAGHNIYPHDVEAEISALPEIRSGRAVAFGVYDEQEGTERLVVLAETDTAKTADKQSIDPDEIRSAIREIVLSKFFVNVSDVRLFDGETLRKSTSGKLARSANREFYLELED